MALPVVLAIASFAVSAINGRRAASKARKAAIRNLEQLRLSAASKLESTQRKVSELRGDLAIQLTRELGTAEAKQAALGISGKTADRIKSNISSLSQKKASELRSKSNEMLFNIARNFTTGSLGQEESFRQVQEGVVRDTIQGGLNLATNLANKRSEQNKFDETSRSLKILAQKRSTD